MRLNRGTDSPINDLLSPSNSSHLARPVRGPHESCHVASVPRRNGAVDPRATWARSPRQPRLGPLATSAAGNFSPFFAILTKKFLKKLIKNQIKIGKK